MDPERQQAPGSRVSPMRAPVRRGLVARVMATVRRVFVTVVAFYCALAALGMITTLVSGHALELGWPIIGVLVFLVAYGGFAWFAEPLYWAGERRKRERARR